MSVIYGLIPGMILLGLVSVLIFFWAVKSGQYDDMEGPAHRILDDDDIDQRHDRIDRPDTSDSTEPENRNKRP